MKNIIILILSLSVYFSYSQEGYNHINLAYGYTTKGVEQFSVAFEFNNRYYNSWELIFEGNRNLDIKEDIYQAGIVYEPLIFKSNNFLFNFRAGFLMGSGSGDFLLSGVGGLELSYTFPSLFVIMLQQNNQYIINIDDRFRVSVLLGLKIPI